MATNTYFALTDGTTTLTFADGAGGSSWYKVQDGWSPRVAPLRNNQLGGRSPLDDVVEEVPITVTGSNAAHLYSNVSALNDLLTQSQRYARGEAVSGVTLNYSIRGGTTSGSATPFRALLLGRAGQSAMLELPQDFDSGGLHYKALNCRMRFLRRGQWVHTGGSQSGSTGAGSDAQIVTISMGATAPTDSPTQITRSTVWNLGGSANGTGIIAITDSYTASDMIAQTVEVADPALSARFSFPAAVAIGGSVLRYTPTATTAISTGSVLTTGSAYTGSNDNGYSLGLYICAYAASAATASTIYATVVSGAGSQSTRALVIDGGQTTAPSWYFLGIVPVTNSVTYMSLTFQAGSAAGYIDVDQILMVNPAKTKVILYPFSSTAGVSSGSLATGTNGLSLAPTSSVNTGTNSVQVQTNGDGYLTTSGSTLYVFQGNPRIVSGSIAFNSNAALHETIIARYPSYATPR